MVETRRRRTRATARGFSLLEILIAVAIIALLSGAIAIAAMSHYGKVRIQTTEADARTIRAAMKGWWIHNDPGTCPSVERLRSDGALDRDGRRTDAWGGPWRLECADQDVTVTSSGPDRKPDTEDDIRIPPPV
jgi:general secretion pathway protein G